MNEQTTQMVITTLIALFIVWLSMYLFGYLYAYWSDFLKKRKFKKLSGKHKGLEVLSFNKNGVPVCVKYMENKEAVTILL